MSVETHRGPIIHWRRDGGAACRKHNLVGLTYREAFALVTCGSCRGIILAGLARAEREKLEKQWGLK